MSGIWRDILFALKSYWRKPGFTVPVLLSLVLGIGTNTAIFTVVDTIFLRPLPVEEMDRLVALYQSVKNESGEYTGDYPLSYANYLDYRERSHSFDEIGLYQWGPMNLTGGSEPQRVTGMYVTANYFDLLGLQPSAGRLFQPLDGERTSEPVAVLSHGSWSRLFGQDSEVVGQTLVVNGESLAIVGIAPAGFRGTETRNSIDVFLPLHLFERMSPYRQYFEMRQVSLLPGLARLRDGVSVEQASDELMGLAQQLAEEHPKLLEDMGGKVLPLVEATIAPGDRGRYQGYAQRLLLVLMILLVACLSVVNLLFVRGVERGRELAVRQAVGSSRRRLLRQLLTENLLLFFLGGLLSLPAAALFLRILWAFRPPEMAANALPAELDGVVWAFTLLLALVVGLLFGLWPALRAARTGLTDHLKELEPLSGARGLPFLLRPRSLLVMAQTAFALVALIGAGLLLQTFRAVLDINLGFDNPRLAVFSVAPGEQGYEELQSRDYYRRLRQRLEALPGVESAAWSENRLLRGAVVRYPVFLPGGDKWIRYGSMDAHRVNIVGQGFFATAGIELVAGRDFREAEPEGQELAIINQTMAETLWPNADAIGQRFHFNSTETPPIEVVGVARNAKYRQVREQDQFFIYRPLAQNYAEGMTLHVRTSGDPASLLPTLVGEARQLDPALVVADVGAMRRFVDEALWLERATTSLAALFGALALILALVGLYGLLSYSVSRRRRELAIRVALGAQRGKLLRGVLLEALWIISVGVVAGAAIATFFLRPVLANQLYGVSVVHLPTYLQWATALLLAALLGSLIPALRAARTHPADALRSE